MLCDQVITIKSLNIFRLTKASALYIKDKNLVPNMDISIAHDVKERYFSIIIEF